MVKVSLVFFAVNLSHSSRDSITDFHSFGRRPAHRIRTPKSFISSFRRLMTSLLNCMRKRTSSGERRQFSVENAYAESQPTPNSSEPYTQSINEASPASCPAVRGNPRSLAQRPLPSITTAMCLGTNSFPSLGGTTPDGCAGGKLTIV